MSQREHNPDVQSIIEQLRSALDTTAVKFSRIEATVQVIDYVSERVSGADPVVELPLEKSICRHVVSMNYPLVIDDVQSHPLTRGCLKIRETGVWAYCGFPIRALDDSIDGVVCAVHDRIHAWTQTEQDLIAVAAQDIAAVTTTIH